MFLATLQSGLATTLCDIHHVCEASWRQPSTVDAVSVSSQKNVILKHSFRRYWTQLPMFPSRLLQTASHPSFDLSCFATLLGLTAYGVLPYKRVGCFR